MMAYTKSQWIGAVTKLIELTSKGKIKWGITGDYVEDGTTVVDRAFEAKTKTNRYVIKAVRLRNYIEEDEFFWEYSHSFEIYRPVFGGGFQLIATAPSLQIVTTLFLTAEANYAVQQGALDELLGDMTEDDEDEDSLP